MGGEGGGGRGRMGGGGEEKAENLGIGRKRRGTAA